MLLVPLHSNGCCVIILFHTCIFFDILKFQDNTLMKEKAHQKMVKDPDDLIVALIQYLWTNCQTITKPSDASLFIIQ